MALPGETIGLGASGACEDCGLTPRLEVLHSAAGYYIGTRCECGPYSRDSGYYPTADAAGDALRSGSFGR